MTTNGTLQRALGAHRWYVRAASALTVFAWIAAYQWFAVTLGDAVEALVRTILLYALAQVSTIAIMPYASSLLRNGIRRTLVIGVLCAAFAYATLGLLVLTGTLQHSATWVLFALLMGAYRALYHVPYALERASLHAPRATFQYIFCLVPIAYGYGMTYGPEITIATGSALLLVSLIPLISIPETYEKYVWGYRETFSKMLEPRFATFIDASITRGIEAAALHFVWPFAVFFILGSSYLWLGFILGFTALFAHLMRTQLPESFAAFSPTVRSVALGSTWIARLMVATPGGVLFASWYPSIVAPEREIVSDETADNSTFIDEFSTLKEMASTAGRLMLALIVALAIVMIGAQAAFIIAFLLAALASIYGSTVGRKV